MDETVKSKQTSDVSSAFLQRGEESLKDSLLIKSGL